MSGPWAHWEDLEPGEAIWVDVAEAEDESAARTIARHALDDFGYSAAASPGEALWPSVADSVGRASRTVCLDELHDGVSDCAANDNACLRTRDVWVVLLDGDE